MWVFVNHDREKNAVGDCLGEFYQNENGIRKDVGWVGVYGWNRKIVEPVGGMEIGGPEGGERTAASWKITAEN